MMQISALAVFALCTWAVFSRRVPDGIVIKHGLAAAAISSMCFAINPTTESALFCFFSLGGSLVYWCGKEFWESIKEPRHANQPKRHRPY